MNALLVESGALVGKTTIPRQNLRRSPATTRLPTRGPVAPARPNNFTRWWAWAIEQVDVARDEPVRLHSENRPVEHQKRRPIIVGWPFSVGFERYLDGRPPSSPWREAMAHLYNPRDRGHAVQCHEYKILFALVNGHDDTEIVRALIGGCRVDFFEAASIRAFELVFDRAKETLDGVA